MIKVLMNPYLQNEEVPLFREAVGWAGARNEQGKLIALGYVAGMGLQHG